MKYEFHVGDYVETVGGFIGWVSYVDRNYIKIKSNEGIISGPWSIPEEQYHFKRIGKYEFTKVDRMEPLPDNNGPMYPNSLMWNKINELVMAVNELRAAQKGET